MTARSEALSTRREALRDDLFGPPQDPIGDDSTRVMDDEPRAPGSLQGDDDEDGGLLELEHVIGFTGAHLSTLVALPRLSNAFVKSMGSVVVVGDVGDPHSQEFLRGHDMDISALAVSGSGALLASGQLGSAHRKGHHAPVIVWDGNTKRQAFVLHGHTLRVRSLCFSPDEARVRRRPTRARDARARRAPLTRPLVARLALSRALPNRSASCARRATTR